MRPNSLVQHHLGGSDPSYLVVAGIVFTVVTGELPAIQNRIPALAVKGNGK